MIICIVWCQCIFFSHFFAFFGSTGPYLDYAQWKQNSNFLCGTSSITSLSLNPMRLSLIGVSKFQWWYILGFGPRVGVPCCHLSAHVICPGIQVRRLLYHSPPGWWWKSSKSGTSATRSLASIPRPTTLFFSAKIARCFFLAVYCINNIDSLSMFMMPTTYKCINYKRCTLHTLSPFLLGDDLW